MKTFFIGIVVFISSLFGVQNHTISQKVVTHVSPAPTHAITITPTPSNKSISDLLKTGVKKEPAPTYVYTPTPTQVPVITTIPQPQANTNTTNNNPQSPNTIFVPVIVKTNTPTPAPVDCSSVSSMVANIKSQGQAALNNAIVGESKLLAQRGIVGGSYYDTQMQAVEQSVQNQTNTAILQFCYNNALTNLASCSCP